MVVGGSCPAWGGPCDLRVPPEPSSPVLGFALDLLRDSWRGLYFCLTAVAVEVVMVVTTRVDQQREN